MAKSKDNHTAKVIGIIGIVVGALGTLLSGIFILLVLTTYGGIQQKASDSVTRTDLNATQANLEAVYASTASYPTLAQLNDASWRSTNMPGLDPSALAPSDHMPQLNGNQPTSSQYTYSPLPTGCDGSAANPCKSYVLSGELTDGQLLTKPSLN